MTNKEALSETLMVSVSDNALEKALIDGGVKPSVIYTAESAAAIDKCAIYILRSLLAAPDVSEGGFSIRYDRAGLKMRLDQLLSKHGDTSNRPIVKARQVW